MLGTGEREISTQRMLQLADLREAAEKATKGPWVRSGVRQKLIEDCLMVGPDTFLIAGVPIGKDDKSHAGAFRDAGYLAKVDPTTILSILDELDAQSATIARLEAALQSIANSPHCAYTDGLYVSDHDSGYKMGIADGHRCAAKMAKAALVSHDRKVKG